MNQRCITTLPHTYSYPGVTFSRIPAALVGHLLEANLTFFIFHSLYTYTEAQGKEKKSHKLVFSIHQYASFQQETAPFQGCNFIQQFHIPVLHQQKKLFSFRSKDQLATLSGSGIAPRLHLEDDMLTGLFTLPLLLSTCREKVVMGTEEAAFFQGQSD